MAISKYPTLGLCLPSSKFKLNLLLLTSHRTIQFQLSHYAKTSTHAFVSNYFLKYPHTLNTHNLHKQLPTSFEQCSFMQPSESILRKPPYPQGIFS